MEKHHVVYFCFYVKIDIEVVTVKKGQRKRVWTPEEKEEIVRKHLEEHVSVRELEKGYQADHSMICRWVKRYIEEGESSFVNKVHPGNHFAVLYNSKNLTEVERLRLMVAKLEIENERLKKGYCVKGVGANKEFVTGKEKNLKLLKHSNPNML